MGLARATLRSGAITDGLVFFEDAGVGTNPDIEGFRRACRARRPGLPRGAHKVESHKILHRYGERDLRVGLLAFAGLSHQLRDDVMLVLMMVTLMVTMVAVE